MHRLSAFLQGPPQAVVAEPGVTNDEKGLPGKMGRDLQDHLYGLRHFRLEGHQLSVLPSRDRPGIDVLLPMVEATGQRQAGPAALDGLEQAQQNDILSPGVLGMIDLGGMIKAEPAAENMFTGFITDAVIESQQQAPVNQGFWDQIPGDRLEPVPWNLGGGHEKIKATSLDIQTEQCLQGTEQIRAHGRGKWHDNGQQDEDEPVSPLTTKTSIRKGRLERGKQIA